MKTFFTKYWLWIWITSLILSFIGGFFLGRSKSGIIKEVKYIKGKTIRDTISTEKLVPYEVNTPKNPDLPVKRDTIFSSSKDKIVIDTIVESVDTSAIIDRYVKENKYSTVLFDTDTLGKLTVNSTVQYNQLKGLGWKFDPMQKETVIERKRNFTPFVMGSYNTFNQAAAGVGFYIKNVGVGAKYIRDLNLNKEGYEGGIYIKF